MNLYRLIPISQIPEPPELWEEAVYWDGDINDPSSYRHEPLRLVPVSTPDSLREADSVIVFWKDVNRKPLWGTVLMVDHWFHRIRKGTPSSRCAILEDASGYAQIYPHREIGLETTKAGNRLAYCFKVVPL